MMRTVPCGALRSTDVDSTHALCGWVANRRDHGGVAFLDLRDMTGVVQVVVDPERHPEVHRVRSEWVLRVEGSVRERPEGMANPDLATGDVEVDVAVLEVLAEAEAVPFPLDDRIDVDESLRLRHRYLDLRRAPMQANLRIRARVNAAVRRSMEDQGFLEVETPLLIASTPEGSRDFVVPSRLSPGAFYALPQSPQLLKQLLMVAGVDRYYQLARCLRDEDLRSDRQFEFTHLDVEMSFATAEDVMEAITMAVTSAAEAVTGPLTGPIPSMTWHEAMARYGTDKPDTRFGLELVDVGEVFAATDFRAFQAEAVLGIRVPGEGDMSRSRLDSLTDRAKELGAAGLVWIRVRADGIESPIAKFLSEAEQLGVVDALGASDGDLALLVAGAARRSQEVLGALRLELARPPVGVDGLAFLWVTDFPLFEGIDDQGRPIPAHHPFTMPHPDDLDLLSRARGEELLAVRSRAYDLVCNGWELGSGSERITNADLQERVLEVIGIDHETARARFGFLLDAFRFGAPPHAGFAVGMDRLVALLAGEENIREVIAFPKTQSGADPLTRAPTPIDDAHLRELGLTLRKPKR